jgi:hypothetical protein
MVCAYGKSDTDLKEVYSIGCVDVLMYSFAYRLMDKDSKIPSSCNVSMSVSC